MTKLRVLVSLLWAGILLIVEVGGAYAAAPLQDPTLFTGSVHSITLETDASTAVTTVIVEVRQGQETRTVRISQETALRLALVTLDDDGRLLINDRVLGKHVEIETAAVLPDPEEKRHPVADALATFFFDGLGQESEEVYTAIMEARDQGVGFGVIAQVLWLTDAIPEGNLSDFQSLLQARQDDDYSGLLADGSTPRNWSELRSAILEGRKVKKLGNVMSSQSEQAAVNPQAERNKDKDGKGKDRTNHGNHSAGNNGNGK